MTRTFERLVGTEDRPHVPFTQGLIDLLESITAVDKALAVPYLRMWQIDPVTGQPTNPRSDDPSSPAVPLNIQLVSPPRFGSSSDQALRERPDVSLDRVSIKTQAPRGIITYQQIEMAFVVHRPDVIFADPIPGVDSWSTLITPGLVHTMEYGWSASPGSVKNGILNGEGFSDLESKPPTIILGRKRLRFVVTNYSFKITPDAQISVAINAYEEGEFNLRQAILGAHEIKEIQDQDKNNTRKGPFGSTLPKRDPRDVYDEVGRKIVGQLQKRVSSLRDKGKRLRGNDVMIRFQDLADDVLAPTIEQTLNEIGFSDVRLLMGDFNRRVGKPGSRYNLIYQGDNAFIGDFEIPFRDIEKVFNSQVKMGSQLTLYNFISQFLTIFRDPRTWDRKNAKKDEGGSQLSCLPEVTVRTIMNPAKRSAIFMIVDVRREFTKFSDSERKPEVARSRSDIRDVLRSKGVPVVSFMRGNSYLQDANFEVVADDQIKSILMRRYLEPARAGVTDASIKQKFKTAVDPREVLYSSAIQGDVTMVGNFAFDLFGLIWMEFGVPQWDGPFSVREREEIIDRTGFSLRISLIAEGSDPLGTQGRLSDVKRVQVEREDAETSKLKKKR